MTLTSEPHPRPPRLPGMSPEERASLQAWVGAWLDRTAGASRVECLYCGGRFRCHNVEIAKTCSPACRKAVQVAFSWVLDEDVPGVADRRDTWSADRAEATGYGLITGAEGLRHDMRLRLAYPERVKPGYAPGVPAPRLAPRGFTYTCKNQL